MVVLTEEFLRKRSEHNEGVLSSLKEISLHQFQIEKIEALGTYCRQLEIVLMQDNLVSKIENLHHLKRLQYLNLAINNVTVIENLESCERLQKLDLSVNFIVDIFSVENLKNNVHLEELCVSLLGF